MRFEKEEIRESEFVAESKIWGREGERKPMSEDESVVSKLLEELEGRCVCERRRETLGSRKDFAILEDALRGIGVKTRGEGEAESKDAADVGRFSRGSGLLLVQKY